MLVRRALEKREWRETFELNVDDRQFLEWLGVDLGGVNVRGRYALKEATVFACVRIRSSAVAKLPLKVYQESNGVIRKATEHYLHRLLKLRPNPYMTMATFLRTLEVQRCLLGNAYVVPEFSNRTGRAEGLYPIDASKVEVWVDDVGLVGARNKVWYVLHVGGERRKLAFDEIIHLKGLTTDGIVGIAPLDHLRYLAESGASATRFVNNFYRHGLQTRGIVHYVGDLNEDAKRKFREKFEDMAAGLKNAHRISMLPVGYQYQPLSLSMADAQFLEITELGVRQLANAFGIKMHQLNDLSRATHTNIEEQQREFYVETLQDLLTEDEQEFTWKLLLNSELEAGYYLRFNVDSILRADIEKRYNAYKSGIQGGFMTPNQARGLEEWAPEEGGDQLLVNGNMIPITLAGQQVTKGGGKAGKRKKDEPD